MQKFSSFACKAENVQFCGIILQTPYKIQIAFLFVKCSRPGTDLEPLLEIKFGNENVYQI